MIETVVRAQSCDPSVRQEAWAQLYETHHQKVYAFIYRRVGSRELAEDLAQDVFVKAMRAVDRWQWRGLGFGAWLTTIARNLIADHFKSGEYRKRSVFDPEQVTEWIDLDRHVSPPAAFELAELSDVLAAVLPRLTAEQQEVLRLRYLEGLSIRDTALKMDRNEGAVKALAVRATRTAATLMPAGYR